VKKINNQKPKDVIGDGDEDKNHNRIQTGRRGCRCRWGPYSGDGVVMGTKYFTVSSSALWSPEHILGSLIIAQLAIFGLTWQPWMVKQVRAVRSVYRLSAMSTHAGHWRRQQRLFGFVSLSEQPTWHSGDASSSRRFDPTGYTSCRNILIPHPMCNS